MKSQQQQQQLRRGRPPRPPPPPPSPSLSLSPSPSPPPSPPRRNLRPRQSTRPLLEDFYGLSASSGEESEAERKGRRKVKLVRNLSGENGNNRGSGARVSGGGGARRQVTESDLSSSSYVEADGESDEGEEEVKPLKKRRISGGLGGRESRLGFEEPYRREVRRSSNGGSGMRGSVSGLMPKAVKRTPLPDRSALEEILEKLQKKDTYGVFADPVDPEELPDYHDVIEHPMDFSTVRRKLARNIYSSFEQFEDDVFLICSNAMQYNAPDTIYFRQAHSIQELARIKFQKLRDDIKLAELVERPKTKVQTVLNRDPVIREKNHIRTNLGEKHTNDRREEREMMPHSMSSHIKFNHKKRKREDNRRRKAAYSYSSNHSWEEREKPSVSTSNNNNNNSNNNKRAFGLFGQEPNISSDISSAGTQTSLSASRIETNNDRIDKDNDNNYDHGIGTNNDRFDKDNRSVEDEDEHEDEEEDYKINNNNNSNNRMKERSVELNVVVNGSVDNNSCSLGESQSDKAGELSARESSPSRPVDTPIVDENRRAPDEIIKKPVDMNRRKTYGICEEPHSSESDPIFDIFADDPKQLLSIGLENEYFYARSLARFAAFLGPTAWKIASNKIEMSLPAGTKFGRGWVDEYEPQIPPIIFSANRIERPRSSSRSGSINNNTSSVGTHLATPSTPTPRATDRNNRIFGAAAFDPVSNNNNNNNNNVREVQQRHKRAGPSTGKNSQVRKSTVEMPQPFLKPPEVTTPRQMNNAPNMGGQNRNSAQPNPMGFITKHQAANQSMVNNTSSNIQRSNVSLGTVANQHGNNVHMRGVHPLVQSVKKEIESPKAMGAVISGQNSWISFGGGASYETKPHVNTVPTSVSGSVPVFLGAQMRPTLPPTSNNNVPHNAPPVWRVVNNNTSPRVSSSAVITSANQGSQGQNCNNNNNHPGLVIFPVQRDMARFQSQIPWQGLMPHNNPHLQMQMQMKEPPQTLRPDLNIGFSSPGSPSGINLEAQQPDLALQL